jgi:hypothetical protein
LSIALQLDYLYQRWYFGYTHSLEKGNLLNNHQCFQWNDFSVNGCFLFFSFSLVDLGGNLLMPISSRLSILAIVFLVMKIGTPYTIDYIIFELNQVMLIKIPSPMARLDPIIRPTNQKCLCDERTLYLFWQSIIRTSSSPKE